MFSRRTFTTAGLALAGGIAGARVVANAAEDAPKRFEIMKTDEEWKKILTKEQYYVLRDHGTERAGTSPLDKVYEPGVYNCAACDLHIRYEIRQRHRLAQLLEADRRCCWRFRR